MLERSAMAMDIEAEIRDLKRRVNEPEGSFGFLSRQVQSVHKDLLRFEEKTDKKLQEHDVRFDRHDARFDRLEAKLDSVDRKIDTKIDGLAKALPGIVGDVVREVLREERGK
jgi:chromosome segregation ATPase